MSAIDSSKSLLIVDDQYTNLTLLSRFLSEYHVTTVDGGALAIEKALEILPDLILLDINMPDIDGYQVCETLKNNAVSTDIPIIFITGLSDPGQINKGFEVGAIDYITKPFSLSEVRARVRNSLALKSARESLIKKNLLLENIIREQSISSELARQVLRFINRDPARYIDLGKDLCLFVHTISQPCYDEGGDHYFVRTIAPPDAVSPRTILSIKDQSGHSVNCILRSIATDLAHNGIIKNNPEISVAESISSLNHAVLQGGIFQEDDFFTGLTLELYHDTLELNYVSAGHPSFLLIRENDVFVLPERGGDGTNLPIAFTDNLTYSAASIKLEAGDRLLLFTDGLTDISLECAGSCFTVEDLVNILKSIPSLSDRPVSYLIQELLHELLTKCQMSDDPNSALFPDDITLMGVEIEFPSPPEVLRVIPADFENIDTCISYILMVLSEDIS